MEERIRSVEKDIEGIRGEIGVIQRRLEAHGKEIDNLDQSYVNLKIDLESIKHSTKFAADGIQEVKGDIKYLIKQREQDHYIDPISNNRKIYWAVGGVLLAFLTQVLLSTLFPLIAK